MTIKCHAGLITLVIITILMLGISGCQQEDSFDGTDILEKTLQKPQPNKMLTNTVTNIKTQGRGGIISNQSIYVDKDLNFSVHLKKTRIINERGETALAANELYIVVDDFVFEGKEDGWVMIQGSNDMLPNQNLPINSLDELNIRGKAAPFGYELVFDISQQSGNQLMKDLFDNTEVEQIRFIKGQTSLKITKDHDLLEYKRLVEGRISSLKVDVEMIMSLTYPGESEHLYTIPQDIREYLDELDKVVSFDQLVLDKNSQIEEKFPFDGYMYQQFNDTKTLNEFMKELYDVYELFGIGVCKIEDEVGSLTVTCNPKIFSPESYKIDKKILLCDGKDCKEYVEPRINRRKSKDLMIVGEGPLFRFDGCELVVKDENESKRTPVAINVKDLPDYMNVSTKRCERYVSEEVRKTCLECLEQMN